MADRQVTCGDATCKQRQHAASCRAWRERNRDIAARHYGDVIKHFRKRHPTYQREWRFLQALRKIRDAIAPELLGLGKPLGGLIQRGERILAARARAGQRGRSDARDGFADALRIAGRLSILLDDLASLVEQLEGVTRSRARYET